MYVIMSDIPPKLKDFLTLKFLSLGLEIYAGDTEKAVEELVAKKGPGYLFVKVNQFSSKWLQFMARIRQYKKEEDYKLLILSDKTERDFIQTLLLLSVTSLIPENLEPSEIYNRLYKLVSTEDIQHEKREFQRVIPRESDDITMNISVPNSSTIITGKVINISIGGIALQLTGTGEARWLSIGQVIDSAQMRMNSKIGMTSLKIIAAKENIIGARFLNPTDYFSTLLGRYLLDRISHG